MQLSIQQTLPPTANGIYTVNAPSFISVSLFWADKNGALDNWTSFANILITPDGEGRFVFDGERAVPQEATHVYAKALRPDLTYSEALQEIPHVEKRRQAPPLMRFVAFSDLHLSNKDWRIRRALQAGKEADCVA